MTSNRNGLCWQHKSAVSDATMPSSLPADAAFGAVHASNMSESQSAHDFAQPTAAEEPHVVLERAAVPDGALSAVRERADGMNRRAKETVIELHVEPSHDTPGWSVVEIVTVGDFSYPDGNLLGVWNYSIDGADALAHGEALQGEQAPDRMQCDHCGQRRRRNLVFVFEDAETGTRKHIGSTCLKDVSGTTLRNMMFFSRYGGILNMDDLTLGTQYGADTQEYLAAAVIAYKRAGRYHRRRDHDATADFASYLYCTRGLDLDDLPLPLNPELDIWQSSTRQDSTAPEEDEWDEANEQVEAILEWASNLDPVTTFDENMQKIASSEWIGKRAIGTAAFMPVAFEKATAPPPPSRVKQTGPVPEERQTREGTIMSIQRRDTAFGSMLKARIRCDGYDIWGTLPKPKEHRDYFVEGDTISFRASAKQVEPGFGYFNDPRSAKLIDGERGLGRSIDPDDPENSDEEPQAYDDGEQNEDMWPWDDPPDGFR